MADAPLDLARRFHEEYERLAPRFGYETRPETRVFDPTSPNGKLMIAVMAALSAPLSQPMAYASSQPWRANQLLSAAQYKSCLPKNRVDFDIPLYR